MAKIVPNCTACKNFLKATDPQTSKAYMGQCMKLEWPYNMNIPKVDGIEGECGYYEGSGPATLQK
ncbi:MAG: hypothetical protein HZA60_05170 [Deltaproteobacteria bacterium]|nr:hypothetical protein [Deltaproteobacteria bacterium]